MGLLRDMSLVFYNVTDLERAKEFYQKTLELTPMFAMEDIGWVEYTAGSGANVAINKVSTGAKMAPGGATAVFSVDDIEWTRGKLEEKGVVFEGDILTIHDVVRLTTFFDPDGNRLMLAQIMEPENPFEGRTVDQVLESYVQGGEFER